MCNVWVLCVCVWVFIVGVLSVCVCGYVYMCVGVYMGGGCVYVCECVYVGVYVCVCM